ENGLDRALDLRSGGGCLRAVALARKRGTRPDSTERPDSLSADMKGPSARLPILLAVALAALTIAVYSPVRELQFVNYDDNVYVTDNPRILQGLTADNLAWSVTAFVGANWHPLTLISHMADVQAFGLDPAGHHAMSLALHVVNVLL